MPARSRGASALPEELLRTVYSAGHITLMDRLRGMAVCRAWRKALANFPILQFDIYSPEEEIEKIICRWATLAQPFVIELFLHSKQELAIQAVHSLQRKELLRLWWTDDALSITRALPVAAIFPNLQQLIVDQPISRADWLAGLGALKSLEELELLVEAGPQPASAPVELPPLLRLTSLILHVMSGTEVQLQLAGLPELAELRLYGDEGMAALVASEPAPQLRHLVGLLGRLTADLTALPGLQYAALNARRQPHQPVSLAAATTLTCLELYDSITHSENEWDLELVKNLPPTVSCLRLFGDWPSETALLLEALPDLQALALDYWDPETAPLPPVGALLWTRLRAFSYSTLAMSAEGLNLPQGLRQASQLQALQACLLKPSMPDVELILSLPGLRKLVIAHGKESPHDLHCTAARSIVQRAMPQVSLVGNEVLNAVDFFEWAFA